MPRRRDTGMPARGRPARGRSEQQHESLSEPEVLRDLIAEAASVPQASASEDGRTVKKRRVGGRLVVTGGPSKTDESNLVEELPARQRVSSEALVENPLLPRQTAYNDFDDSDSEDVAWEDVGLGIDTDTGPTKSGRELKDLSLDLQTDELELGKSTVTRRKLLTAAERKVRLDMHKMHILALLSHLHLRNHWCNDLDAQTTLRKLLPTTTVKYLEDDEAQSQFQRSRSLTEGLEKASEVFRMNFEICARGMRRNYWAEDQEQLEESSVPDDIDLPIRKEDFRDIAQKLSGSRDVGAQLFCAMLRAVNLDARIACSLQPLPFTSLTKNLPTPSKPAPVLTVAYPETRQRMDERDSGSEELNGSSSRIKTPDPGNYSSPDAVPKPVRRFGRPGVTSKPTPKANSTTTPPKPKKRRIKESPYPIFWVEVFNHATQKWIPVDPLVTKTIGRPSKFEPPASDAENNMSYVIAFEEDGEAKDVTRRYAKAFNAKTRRSRVESTRGGGRWWKRVIRMYQSHYQLDRDQVENAELAAKEAQEPMPKNIQDFKNHPYYALERHLRRNEVLHPKRQVGKVSAGVNKPLEPIYRRRDVHTVKSADGWFRLGREIKNDEVPLKFLEPRRKKGGRMNTLGTDEDPFVDDETQNERPGQPMYGAFQTSTYVPPPVAEGRVPRNMYGNIDVYTASMVPSGGVWVAHPFAAGAAKLLGVDYADAVTGFEFKGRTGTAVIKGVVVATEFHEGLVEAIQGFQYAFEQEEDNRRAEMALRTWKRYLVGLRIRERIAGYENEHALHREDAGKGRYDDSNDSDDDRRGGFLPNPDVYGGAEMPEPEPDLEPIEDLPEDGPPLSKALLDAREEIVSTWGKPLPKEQPAELPALLGNTERTENEAEAGGFLPETAVDDSVGGGGFIVAGAGEASHYGGGGFVVDEDAAIPEEMAGGLIAQTEEGEPEDTIHVSHEAITAKELQRLYDNEKQHTNSRPAPPEAGLIVENEESARGENGRQKDADVEEEEEERLGEMQLEEDKDDIGSLLSHDPEDEDATPEWLA